MKSNVRASSNLSQVLNGVVDALHRLHDLLMSAERVSALPEEVVGAVRQVQTGQILKTNHPRKVLAKPFVGLTGKNSFNNL